MEELRSIVNRVAKQFAWFRVKVKRDNITGIDSRVKLENSRLNDKEPLWGDDLYVQVVDDEKEYARVQQVTIDNDPRTGMADGLCSILNDESTEEWHDEDPNASLWRVTLVRWKNDPRRFALVLALHHLICDGVASVQVAQVILDAVGNKSRDQPCSTSIKERLLSPPMEDLVDTATRLSHLLMPVLLDRFPGLTEYLRPPHWKGRPDHVQASSGRRTEMICITLTDSVQEIRDKCKIAGRSINSKLVAALASSIAKRESEQPPCQSTGVVANGCKRLKIQVAADEDDVEHHRYPVIAWESI